MDLVGPGHTQSPNPETRPMGDSRTVEHVPPPKLFNQRWLNRPDSPTYHTAWSIAGTSVGKVRFLVFQGQLTPLESDSLCSRYAVLASMRQELNSRRESILHSQ